MSDCTLDNRSCSKYLRLCCRSCPYRARRSIYTDSCFEECFTRNFCMYEISEGSVIVEEWVNPDSGKYELKHPGLYLKD